MMRQSIRCLWAWGIVAVSMLLTASSRGIAGDDSPHPRLTVLVNAGEHARKNCPILVTLPKEIADAQAGVSQGWVLTETTGRRSRNVPCQVMKGTPLQLAWIIEGTMEPDTEKTFLYAFSEDDANDQGVRAGGVEVLDDERNLEIRLADKPVLRYRMAHVEPPEGADPKYGRSGYIHPVWTPGGAIVTDEFPADHLHQDGIFLAYTKTEFEGRTPNFWDLLGGTGFVRFAEKIELYEGPVAGGFRVRHEHVDAGVEGGKVALNEVWDVRVWNTVADESYRFEISSAISCATISPLKLVEYHYGGMAIRGAGNWINEEVSLVTSEGVGREQGNHARVPWVDLSGNVADEDLSTSWAGITVFTDPVNFRYPEPVRLHPTMPYFVYTPSVLGEWSFEPESVHRSRYHYYVHDGRLNADRVNQVGMEIVSPPTISTTVEK